MDVLSAIYIDYQQQLGYFSHSGLLLSSKRGHVLSMEVVATLPKWAVDIPMRIQKDVARQRTLQSWPWRPWLLLITAWLLNNGIIHEPYMG